MNFDSTIIEGIFLKRYKRFFSDIKLSSGEIITAHTPNTGPMTSCLEAGSKVGVLFNNSPTRKLKYTLEMSCLDKTWVGLNTHRANQIVFEGLVSGKINDFGELTSIRREVKYNDSRIDFHCENKNEQSIYIEVKSVTYKFSDKLLVFPDSVTKRGQKHLYALMDMAKSGHRAVILYLAQRNDAEFFRTAKEIDPTYNELLEKAIDTGVEILIYQCEVSLKGIDITRKMIYTP